MRNAILQILAPVLCSRLLDIGKQMLRCCVVSSELGTCTLSRTLILPTRSIATGQSLLFCTVLVLQIGCDEETQSLQKIPPAECSAGAVQRSSLMAAHEHEPDNTVGRATEFSDCTRSAALCRRLNRLMRARRRLRWQSPECSYKSRFWPKTDPLHRFR
jgi:hypothetical protein